MSAVSARAAEYIPAEETPPDPAVTNKRTYPQLDPDPQLSAVSPESARPNEPASLTEEVSIPMHYETASMAVANRYMLQTSCTVYDASTDTYQWRSLLKTSREDIGDYGVGFQLYFDFLAKIAIVLFVLGIISLPLLVFSYQGDFAGVSAGFFAKTTIGNIGICGDYGQLCPVVASYAQRLLISGATTLLRTATPAFGALASLCIAVFALFGMYFYYVHLPKTVQKHDAKHTSLDDYSVEVDYLPHRLDPVRHSNYEQLLKAHFEKIVGKENSVAQVSVARDYNGAVRTFLELSDLEIEMKEALEQSRKAATAKEADKWKAYLKKLEKKKKEAEDHVKNQTLVDEKDRPVVKGFITFNETRYRDRVLTAYSWSRQHFIFRLLQIPQLRFQGRPLYVRKASEPGNLYYENLDISKKNVFLRTVFTIAAAILVLIFSAVILTLTQTATRASGPQGLGSKQVWIIANSSVTADSTCFGSCAISIYSDPVCTGEALVPTGLLDSTGVYSPGTPPIATLNISASQASTCSGSRNWFSNRCTSISGGDQIFNSAKDLVYVNVSSSSSRRLIEGSIDTFSNKFQLPFVKAQVSASATVSESPMITRSSTVRAFTVASLPASSGCPSSAPNKCSSSSNGASSAPDLNFCYSNAQKCDKIWDCPFGDDESGCGYACDSDREFQCPSSGKCVDILTGTCGSECLTMPSSSVCTAISDRNTKQATAVRSCDVGAVESILANTYNGGCPGGFYLSPCCTLSNLSDYDRYALMCQADSMTLEVKGSFSVRGVTILEYMQNYCLAFDRNNNAGQLVCPDETVSKLVLISPNCESAFVHDRRWCECLTDVSLLPGSVRTSLESCHVDSSNWLYLHSVRGGSSRHMSVVDSIRIGCQQQGFRASTVLENENLNSPHVSLGFQFAATKSISEATVEQVLNLLPQNLPANVVVSGGLAVSSSGTAVSAIVRIDINDVSNSTDQATWFANVNSAYNSVMGSVSALSIEINQISSLEPHCSGTQFQCPITRRCIASSQVCDGVPDCEIPVSGLIQTPDENSCSDVESSAPNPTTGECANDQFMCQSRTQCIPDLYWCDGVNDCADSSDENNSDCVVQFATRTATNSSVAVAQPYLASEYIGFHFDSPVSVGCIAIDQANVTLIDKVSIFACSENVVFRPGVGTVLRYPDLNCIKVQTTSMQSKSPPSFTPPLNPSDLAYTPLTGFPVGCSSSNDQCAILEGNPSSFCDPNSSICESDRNGTISEISVLQTPQCDYGSPISPTVAASIKESFTDSSGSVNNDLYNEVTYTCFCDQQIQYNSATNMFFMYPPYESYIQVTCEPYYKMRLTEKALRFVGIVVVAILNFFLLQLMYFLANFERPYTLTDKAASELWKLFLAQFINTAILVLLVNARFGTDGSGWKVLGFGNGAYDDTTREWFRNVGAGIALTVLIMIGTIIVPTYAIEKIWQHYRRKWARKKLTQEAMNRQLQRGDFLLSARLAQSTNVIVCVVMYFSGIPIMLWIGVAYCIIAYWFDKYYLLRCSKIPPQYSSYTMKICLRLLPIAVIANCCFMIWTFGNQSVFPSDFLSDAISSYYNDTFGGEDQMTQYEYGQLGGNTTVTYSTYLVSRLYESLRKAAFGGLFILGLVVGYFVFFFLYYLVKNTFWAIISIVMLPFKQKKRARKEAQNRAKGFFGLQVPNEAPNFDEAKTALKKARLASSYKMQDHPRYAPAYVAMNKIRSQRIEQDRRNSLDSPQKSAPTTSLIQERKASVDAPVQSAVGNVTLDSSFRPK